MKSRWPTTKTYEILSDSAYGSFSTIKQSLSALVNYHKFDVAASFLAFSSQGHRAGAGGNEIVGKINCRYRINQHWTAEVRNKTVHLRGADPGPITHPNPDHWYDVWRDNVSIGLVYKKSNIQYSITPHLNVGIHKLYDGFLSKDFVLGGISEFQYRFNKKLKLYKYCNN